MFFTALKSIIGEVIPENQEPYSEFRPEEEISSLIAPGAVLARMTPSILLTMFGNKVLVELKRKLYEIYTGKPWKPVTESFVIDDKTEEELLLESVTDIYREKNINDEQSYYANKEFKSGTTICPIELNGKPSIVWTYIKSSKNPNCYIKDGLLITSKDIKGKEELTIPEKDTLKQYLDE